MAFATTIHIPTTRPYYQRYPSYSTLLVLFLFLQGRGASASLPSVAGCSALLLHSTTACNSPHHASQPLVWPVDRASAWWVRHPHPTNQSRTAWKHSPVTARTLTPSACLPSSLVKLPKTGFSYISCPRLLRRCFVRLQIIILRPPGCLSLRRLYLPGFSHPHVPFVSQDQHCQIACSGATKAVYPNLSMEQCLRPAKVSQLQR